MRLRTVTTESATEPHLGCPVIRPVSGGLTYASRVNAITTGYARCSTGLQDLTAQREILLGLGVPEDRIYLDKGLTGTATGQASARRSRRYEPGAHS